MRGMKNPRQIPLALAFVLAILAGPELAHAQIGPNELVLPFQQQLAVKLQIVELPELWREPPRAVPAQLTTLLPLPVDSFDIDGVVSLRQPFSGREPWPRLNEPAKLSLGLSGHVAMPRLRWLVAWSCPTLVGVHLPQGPCQAQVGFKFSG